MNNNMEDSNSFFDKFGLLHTHRGVYSENGPLFTAHYLMLNTMLKTGKYGSLKPIIAIRERTWFNPNPSHDNDENCHFSHDNMTGLYSMCATLGVDYSLPTMKWNNRYWLHPRDTIYYNILKGRKLFYLGLPLLYIMARISCSAPEGETSGKCMWWLRLNTLIEMKIHRSKILQAFGRYTLKKVNEDWSDVFSIYFAVEDHPLHKLMEELYE